jgi:hypothetical protein
LFLSVLGIPFVAEASPGSGRHVSAGVERPQKSSGPSAYQTNCAAADKFILEKEKQRRFVPLEAGWICGYFRFSWLNFGDFDFFTN